MTTKQLGDLMLQGWTMLGETCPNGCQIPLMLKKSTGEKRCVGCPLQLVPIIDPQLPTLASPTRGVQAFKNDILLNKIRKCLERIQQTDDLTLIRQISDVVIQLTEVYKRLKDLDV
jgi:uncharacterized Zn finger protein (UPF0148 family)